MGTDDRVALQGGILENARSIPYRAPPLGGELTDLSGPLRHARYQSALTIDNAGKPAPREIAGVARL